TERKRLDTVEEGSRGMIALSLEDEMMWHWLIPEGHLSILDISAAFNDAMNLNVDTAVVYQVKNRIRQQQAHIVPPQEQVQLLDSLLKQM
ncbi:hypothetical protein LSTR_LSTR015464, partial [Laodelphax striatellus]